MKYLSLLKQSRIQLLIIVFAIVLAYANIFQNSFQGDDYNIILNWDFIHHLENIPKIFTQNVLPEPYSRYKPIVYSLIGIYYHFFGSNPFGYHIHSIVSHIVKTVLVYLIVEQLVYGLWFMVHREKQKNRSKFTPGVSKAEIQAHPRGVQWGKPHERLTINYLPFTVALIFGLHPVQVESVTHVIVSLDGTGYIFYLASFWAWLKFRSRTRFVGNFQTGFGQSWYWASAVLALLAFFSYELTLTLPLVIVFYDFCFRREAFKSKNIRSTLLRYAPFFIAAAVYLIIRSILLHHLSSAQYLADSFYLTMLTMTRVFVLYLTLLVAPLYLSMSHFVLPGVRPWVDAFTNLDAIRAQSIFQIRIMFNIAVILALVLIAVRSYKKFPLITFAIGWFFISLLPILYLIPQDAIVQERFLYLGVMAFGLIVGLLMDLFLSLRTFNFSVDVKRYMVVAVLIVLTGAYIWRIHLRNRDWRDDIAIYSSVVAQTPDSILDNYLLAVSADNVGQQDLALKYYLKTLALEPGVVDVYKRLAKIYAQKGNFAEALANWQKTIQLTPSDLAAQAEAVRLELKYFPTYSGESVRKTNGYIGQIIEKSVFIFYPENLSGVKIKDGVILKDSKDDFQIEIVVTNGLGKTPEVFLAESGTYGTLVNQGPAKIPNFEKAYVKVWEAPISADKSNQRDTLQFFLFKGERVIEVLVSPADSPEMRVFDQILGSLEFYE